MFIGLLVTAESLSKLGLTLLVEYSVSSSLTFLRDECKNVNIRKPLLSLIYTKQDQLLDKNNDRTLQECFQWAPYSSSINS